VRGQFIFVQACRPFAILADDAGGCVCAEGTGLWIGECVHKVSVCQGEPCHAAEFNKVATFGCDFHFEILLVLSMLKS
jgi:hypothetical protein